MKSAVKITVKGFVQGVGYRYFCYRKAIEYEISGYTKNLTNGDVELEAEGEKEAIDDFIEELKAGPRSAQVRQVLREEIPYKGMYSDFKMY